MMKNRILCILIVLCMAVTMIPTITLANYTAKPSKTNFVMKGSPVSVTAAYNISGTNYLQLRAIAAMLNGTASQFDVSWDGQYAVIDTGKPYSGSVTETKLKDTTNVRPSSTKFKLNGRVISFADARLIDGDTNYLQLREFAQLLSGTASQFNVYWDSKLSQAVLEPGTIYTGNAPGAINYKSEDVTWIGATGEYKKTIEEFFDKGLRKVPVGDLAPDKSLTDVKYGLVDSSGAWAAQPIYDKIQAEYFYEISAGDILRYVADSEKPSESIFVDGYVQATRDGKMGLLDSSGKEVIPCKYDAVGLPVEGISRLIVASGDKYYLGYWNLEQKKEIVPPNKYVLYDMKDTAAGGYPIVMAGSYYKYVSDKRVAVRFDFNDGYAMVPTSKTETLSFFFKDEEGLSWQEGVKYTLTYAQIIDKNGKEILSKSYPYLTNLALTNYPQAGPYMVFEQLTNKRISMITDHGNTVILDSHLAEGVVGPKGVVIPAEYHGAIAGSEGKWVLNSARMQISLELSMVSTIKCGYEKLKEGIFPEVVVDFNNKEQPSYLKYVGDQAYANTDKLKFGDLWKDPDPDRTRFKISVGTGTIGGTYVKRIGNSLHALFDAVTGKQLTPTYLSMRSFGRGLFNTTHGDYYGPDGKIVFPRSEKVTLNDRGIYGNESGTGEDLTLIIKDDKVGYVNASRLAREGRGLPTEERFKPAPPDIKVRGYLVQYPDKQLYKLGEGFDTKGLIVHYQDIKGVRTIVDNSKLKFITSGTVELTQGRAFTTAGVKTVEIYYMDELVDTFQVKVAGDAANDTLGSGNYYMQIYGKYIYPVMYGNTYHLELSDKKPEKPFIVKLLDFDDERGPQYSISYDETYIAQPSSKNGDQLVSSLIPHMWRINKYTSFCTIRDYGNQKLTVNASGQKSDNGTKVTIWSYTGSAPEHAKITFIKE